MRRRAPRSSRASPKRSRPRCRPGPICNSSWATAAAPLAISWPTSSGSAEGNLQDWRGYAETSAAAQRLNRLVTDALLSEGVRVVSLQPSASARCHDGELVEMAIDPW